MQENQEALTARDKFLLKFMDKHVAGLFFSK